MGFLVTQSWMGGGMASAVKGALAEFDIHDDTATA
jgi:hypothetical protein